MKNNELKKKIEEANKYSNLTLVLIVVMSIFILLLFFISELDTYQNLEKFQKGKDAIRNILYNQEEFIIYKEECEWTLAETMPLHLICEQQEGSITQSCINRLITFYENNGAYIKTIHQGGGTILKAYAYENISVCETVEVDEIETQHCPDKWREFPVVDQFYSNLSKRAGMVSTVCI